MKIIHFADAHIGVDSTGPVDPKTGINGRVLDTLDMLDSIIDFAEEAAVDLIIFAGDAFHRFNPHPKYLAAFSERIARMMRICPTVLLVGNHDMAPSANALAIYQSLKLDGIVIGDQYEVHIIETKSGGVQVATAPYPSKRLFKTKEELHQAIYALGEHIDDSMPSIFIGHFSVSCATYGAERGYVVGDDAEVDLEILADPVWDYIALGHLHTHQAVFDNPPVVYAGSIERVTFNEEHEAKGFVLLEIDEQHAVTWEFIELDVRPYVTIEVKTLKRNITQKVLAQIDNTPELAGSVARLVLKIDPDNRKLIDMREICDAFERAGVYFVANTSIIDIVQRNTERIEIANIASLGPEELLTKYMQLQGYEPKQIKAFMPLAREIMNGEDHE